LDTKDSIEDSATIGKIRHRHKQNYVGVLLKKMEFSLHGNRKKLGSGNETKENRRLRNQQFCCIRRMREQFTEKGYPVVSVDTKKKEDIGNFKNTGRHGT